MLPQRVGLSPNHFGHSIQQHISNICKSLFLFLFANMNSVVLTHKKGTRIAADAFGIQELAISILNFLVK
jgi:hypothetical protein